MRTLRASLWPLGVALLYLLSVAGLKAAGGDERLVWVAAAPLAVAVGLVIYSLGMLVSLLALDAWVHCIRPDIQDFRAWRRERQSR